MKIKQTPENELKTIVFENLCTAYENTSPADKPLPAPDRLAKMVEIITKEVLLKHFPNADTSDIVDAFDKGSLGFLGEFYGITVTTVSVWMQRLLDLRDDARATNCTSHEAPPPPKRTPEELKYFARSSVNECYKLYCKGGYYFVPASLLLRTLREDNLIDMIDERMEWATEKATDILTTRFYKERRAGQTIADYIQASSGSTAAKCVIDGFFNEMIEAKKTEIYENLEKPETITEEL